MSNLQNNVSGKSKTEGNNNKTIIDHIEYIIELAEKFKLSDEFYNEAEESINYVSNKMDITSNAAVVFAFFIANSNDNRLVLSEIARLFGLNAIETLKLMSCVNELVRKGLILSQISYDQKHYRVPLDVIEATILNKPYIQESTDNLSHGELFNHFNKLFRKREDGFISTKSLVKKLHDLIDNNLSLRFCKQIKEYEEMQLNDNEFLFLLYTCHQYVNEDENKLRIGTYHKLYDDKWEYNVIKKDLENMSSNLVINNILLNEPDCYASTMINITPIANKKLLG